MRANLTMKNKGSGNMKLFIFGKSTNSRFVGSKRKTKRLKKGK